VNLRNAVIQLLRRAIRLSRELLGGTRRTELDHLAGTWSREEADAFDRRLADQRPIDADLGS